MHLSGLRRWSVAALALLCVSAPAPLLAANDEPVRIGSLSGAFLAARVAEIDNDLDSTIKYYRRALSFDRDNQTLQQSLLLALISRGDFEAALPLAEKLKSVPQIERFSRVALAIDAIGKQDYAAAENYLKLALESDLDRLITGVMTGWALQGAGKAADGLSLVRGLDGPEWFVVFKSYHEALIAEAAGNVDGALEAYGRIAENATAGGAAPDTYLRALEAYARLLSRQGQTQGALAELDRAEAFAANRPAVVALRRDIETGADTPPLVATPGDGVAEILLNLGTALNRGGGEAFVRIYLQLALALKSDFDAALVQLGQVSEQQGDAEEAISFYEKVPGDSPLHRIAALQLGLNLADLDRHEAAKVHLRQLLLDDPDDMRAYMALGGVLASKEEYAEAAMLYDDAVERIDEPERADWNIFYQRGIAYERLKQWPKAEPNFRKALELYPDQPQVLNYLGYSWVDMNINLEEGLDLIRRAVSSRPNDGYIVDSLGWAYYRLGRFEEAVGELERAVSLKPDDPILNDHLGDAYWRAGRRLEATFQWAHARDMKPDPDVLVEVERKLTKGLPPLEEQKAEIPPIVLPDPAPEKTGGEAAAADEEGAARPASHVVGPGQSLWSIAAEKLGDGGRYIEILDLNPQLRGNPGNIVPGQELILPGN